MPSAASDFAQQARQYCNWHDSLGTDESKNAATALRQLTELYIAALRLDYHGYTEPDRESSRLPSSERAVIRMRARRMPFDYYGVVGTPHEDVPPTDGLVASLSEDLEHIRVELEDGLALFDEGLERDAESTWQEFFAIHWGSHLTSALQALHKWTATRSPFDYAAGQ